MELKFRKTRKERLNSTLDEEHMNAQEALLIMALTMGRNHFSCLDSVGTSVASSLIRVSDVQQLTFVLKDAKVK